MNRKDKYELSRRIAGYKNVGARLNSEQAVAVGDAGGATAVLREQAAILIAIKKYGAAAVQGAALKRMQGDMGALDAVGVTSPTLATAARTSVAAVQSMSPKEQALDLAEVLESLSKIANR